MLIEFNGVRPRIAADVYVAPTAVIIGDVTIGAGSSVWFGAVIRGDAGPIIIGERVSVQDNVVIHVNDHDATVLEDDVLVGHAAVLEGCHVGRFTMVGMRATVLSGARIGAECLIAAGAVVREQSDFPPRTLIAGVPAVGKGPLPLALEERIKRGPRHYQEYAQLYATQAKVVG
jgi:carbonic anhydrase/acetyltransferase-like protein (isoleucine patch superfamily)